MAFIPVLLFGLSALTLTTLFKEDTQAEPPSKTPEQKLADAIAEYMKSRSDETSD
ncbi:MAG: hypothetical protein AAF821_01640 [Cyanobacteria bacterium P01_D01_bin.156]